jgi:shikimate kinase/3-dehydroquinate synthase
VTDVVLTGFMGTGKTTVGREVARRLGWPFVDMDAEIKARAGKSIPRIFAEDGEAAFRHMEAALCQELSAWQGLRSEPFGCVRDVPAEGLVVATGGGTLVDPANRALMMGSGTVVCLTCAVDEILRRMSGGASPERPLLDVADPRAEIERLLEVRREAYRAIPWHIDTTGLPVEGVAARVVQLARVITLPVHYPGGRYDIHVGDGLLAHVGGALRATGVPEGSRVAVVSSPVVAPLYGAQVEAALRSAGLQPFACSIPDGERHKTLATVTALYGQFLAGRLDRSGTVLSLGGGVAGDVAGFAAATFMRGLRFVQVPTTLLAMVDASVGGKTGVNLPEGKNLVGAFRQPALVVVDPAVLATLPVEEIRSGMAEVIKHGVIGDPALFAELEAGTLQIPNPKAQSPNLQSQSPMPGLRPVTSISGSHIARALRVKIAVVEEDPFEQGQRAVLNLGHTVGHALERLSGFTLRHGEGVGIGMVAAARIAAALGRADPALADRIEGVLAAWGLPVRCPRFDRCSPSEAEGLGARPFDADGIWVAMAHDKKRRGRSLRWVLPRAIGEVETVDDVPRDVVIAVLRDLGAG